MSKPYSGLRAAVDLQISYPADGTIFPPEIVPPSIRWTDNKSDSDSWQINFRFGDENGELSFNSSQKIYSPPAAKWEEIKLRSLEKQAKVTIAGYKKKQPERILSKGIISISTSKDKVDAPIFYREVNIPFAEAVKNPEKHIRWRFGSIGSKELPRVVLEKIPTCANCHAFSKDGKTLAMEIDSANDKGSYVIAPVAEEMVFDKEKIITWSDYKREEKEATFGLLAQISPDGRYVVCTVKDNHVSIARPDLMFSQLFFPIRGILCYYDRETKSFHSLPGADNRDYVHSSPGWSPDTKYLVFARARAYAKDTKLRTKSLLLTAKQMKDIMTVFKTWKYDLYRIPFNGGKGGKPEPLEGASSNGMSNYFPKYSPDGKWIIFCKARNYMLLQPDSELYIIPASGGKARRLRCNTSRMNSWHSWSPNGRWLVFSSKENGPYTQLFLTHIDEEGRSTPPVLLENFTAKDRAANIPEFLNAQPGAIKKIRQEFVDDESFFRASLPYLEYFSKKEDLDGAEKFLRKALAMNPSKSRAYHGLGMVYLKRKKIEAAEGYFKKAIELNANNAEAYNALGLLMNLKRNPVEAEKFFLKAVSINSHPLALSKDGQAGVYLNLGRHYLSTNQLGLAEEKFLKTMQLEAVASPLVNYYLGKVFLRQRNIPKAIEHLKKGLDFNANNEGKKELVAVIHFFLGGLYLHEKNEMDVAIKHYQESLKHHPRPAAVYNSIGIAYAKKGDFTRAVEHWQKTLSIEPNNMSARRNLANVPPSSLR
ncbi:tetratricopeptide repeat protein [Candidatus Riflebacteria bacterium]